MGRTISRFLTLSTLLATAFATVPAADAQDAGLVASYFDQLRTQGLFGLAERYGLDRRAELPLQSAESVQLAVELSRTFAHHARTAPTAEEQSFLQTRADEALDDYRGDEPYPRIEAVALERTYRVIDRAELAWWNSTAAPEDAAAQETAAEHLVKALSALESWTDSAAESAAKPANTRRPDDLTRRELAGLIHAARLKSVDILLLTAELAATKAEKERWIRQVEDQLRRLMSSAERGTTAAIRGYEVRIARLLGNEQELNQRVRRTTTDRLPLEVRQDAVAEQARFQLDQGRFEAAARLLVESKESLGSINDRLRALHVEAVLGMSRAAGPQRSELLATAERELADVAGPWRLRSEYLLQEARQVEKYGHEAAELVRRGNREFRGGSRDAAIATFRQAADLATVAAGRAELRFMTASLLVEAQRFSEAVAECELVSKDAPTTELAARASLLTAYCLGRIAANTRNANDRDRYERSLVEHLRRFPEDNTTGDAAWMLGTLALQEGRLAAIVDAEKRMPQTHPKAEASRNRAIEAVLKAQEELRTAGVSAVDGRDASAWDADAQRLADRLLNTSGEDIAAARRMLTAARLSAAVSSPNFESVLAILKRIPQPGATQSATPDWQQLTHDATALRLVCLTATGQFAAAADTLQQLQSLSVAELLKVLRKLSAAGQQLAGPRRTELASLELATIRRIRLHPGDLTSSERQLLAECEAEALFASGQYAEAARMFDEAVAGKPDLAPRLAEALEKSLQPADLARALKIWQQQIPLRKQGTAEWFQAQLRIARILLALGQTTECLKLIRSLRLAYPDLASPALKQAFNQLEQEALSKVQ